MTDPRLTALRRAAIVPAFNEEASIGRVIDELRRFDPGLEIVVVDDGSIDHTAAVARRRGAHVLRLPFNLGIGGAVQTGFRYAWEKGFDIAVRVDGDGQHDAAQLDAVLEPVLAGEADIAVGSRFAGRDGYRSSRSRRVGIRLLAWIVSALVRQRVTDTTSGFQAVNRLGIKLFAADYPHDYPEVEATVMLFKHRLRLREVPVAMRRRETGRSSITAVHSVYYMVKVLLALFVAIFRRRATPLEEEPA
jgi:glycosyltransferase involved in cell wall biosynthesis